MLIIARKQEENTFIISPDEKSRITVKILEIRNGQVKLGIDAPKSFKIFREEVEKRISQGK